MIVKVINSLHDPTKPNVILLYGDGMFSSGNWSGQKAVPVKEMRSACERCYEVMKL